MKIKRERTLFAKSLKMSASIPNKSLPILPFIISIIIMFSFFFSGCTTTRPEGDWDEVISSYNPQTNKFEDFDGTVLVEDIVKSMDYVGGKTRVVLQSNSKIPVYISSAKGHQNPERGDLTPFFENGDRIVFEVHIKEDGYGEYIEELSK